MKHLFTIITFCALLMEGTVFGQRVVEITTDNANPTDIVQFIVSDSLADGSYDPTTIYLLDNNGLYVLQNRLNPPTPIRLHAKDTSNKALKPFLFRLSNDDGSWPGEFWPIDDVELINIWYVVSERGPLEQHQWGRFRPSADSVRITFKDCIIEKDRGGIPQIRANGLKIYVENTIWSNLANRKVQNGNGRGIDARDFSVDTLIVRNSVMHNVLDRLFRSQGTTVPHNYIEFDHITVFNHMGRHGAFQFGWGANTVKVTNSIFENPIMWGMTPIYNNEQFQEDSDNKFLFTIDGDQDRVDSIGTNFTFDNNNIYYTQNVLDYYASNDTVSQPGIYSQEIVRRMGGQSIADTTYFSEVLEFINVPVSAYPLLEDLYADPAATDMFDIIVEPPGYVALEGFSSDYENFFDFEDFDVGYSEESVSRNAATDGGSIGARFGSFGVPPPDEVLGVETNLVETFFIYPNPNNGPATFRYALDKNDEVLVTLLDMNGRNLGILDSGFKTQGKHELKVELGKYITEYGVYFAKFKSSDKSRIMRLVYSKK